MVYSAKLNGTTFFSTQNDSDEYLLTSAKITKEAGVSGNFTFVIPPVNSFYDSFHKLTDYVDVYRDDNIIFSGRVYSISEKFDKQRTVVCESMIAILNDTIFRPDLYENITNRELFETIITNHNNHVEAYKQLTIGRITVNEAPCYRDYQKIESSLKRINDLSESFDGRVEVRKQNGNLYIDWLKSYDQGNSQLIDFGSNILKLEKTENAATVVTVLIPTGANDEDGNPIDITSVTEGNVDYVIASDEHIQKYGYIYGTKNWKDVTVPQNLKTKAEAWVDTCCSPQYKIVVNAVDLADAGLATDNFDTGQKLKVRSVYHGFDGGDNCWFECKKISTDLLNPSKNKLELGTTTKGYVQSRQSASSDVTSYIEKVAAGVLTKTALELAIERATNLITGAENSYIYLHDTNNDGTPDEILVMDTPDIATAVKIWRWNNSGLGFSSNGYDGPYGLAITIDGEIVADYVTSGTLNAEIIKAGVLKSENSNTYWDLDEGRLSINSDNESNYTYTNDDVTRISDIIMGTVYPNEDDYDRYDFDSSGTINNRDYQICKKCVDDYDGIYSTEINIEPGSLRNAITIESNTGNKTSIGPGNISTDYIDVSTAMYSNGNKVNFVEEYGRKTYGGHEWRYHKWNNGYYECWTSIKINDLNINEEWGYLYSGTIGSFQFPVTFRDTPNLQTSIYWGTGAWFLSASNQTATTFTTPTYYALRPTSSTIDVGITIAASGYIT